MQRYALCVLLAASAACNYARPVMYVDVVNLSGRTINNVEVKHPARGGTGQFGLPSLGDEQTHRHMIPQGEPCRFRLQFDDTSGKQHAQDFDLGAKCPTQVRFEIDPAMSVSYRTAMPRKNP